MQKSLICSGISQVVRPLTRPLQHQVDAVLVSIAQAYEVEWQPPYLLPEQRYPRYFSSTLPVHL